MHKRKTSLLTGILVVLCLAVFSVIDSKQGNQEKEIPPARSQNVTPPSPSRTGHNLSSKTIRIVTWNGREIFDTDRLKRRHKNFSDFGKELAPDILLIQEVTSLQQLKAIRKAMNLTGYFVCCSDFFQNDHDQHQSFEVGVLSRFPFSSVIENDPSPDNRGRADEPVETRLKVPNRAGLKKVPVGRGFLRVQLDDLKLILNVTHLKSSNGKTGKSDFKNARKRELVAAAIAAQVNRDRKKHPRYSILVAGDFNIGETDSAKNGTSLTEDTRDGYDDTHAIFYGKLVGNLHMTSLTRALGKETWRSKRARGTGPIDCIYVIGKDRFSSTRIASRTYGSDHFPVSTQYRIP